ncbi:MAG: ribosome small subunit-dependent GTPase A [Clostridia bacterium]|nr:ribosome small subunit-dependent GTPase A [Clostridia bacterium]
MRIEKQGKVVKGLGGLFETRVVEEDGSVIRYACRAKGALHRGDAKVLVGDNVVLSMDTATPDDIVLSAIGERKNALIRPPMANLDILCMVVASAKPAPVLETVDKLLSIAEHHGIEPVLIFTKTDVDRENAERLAALYRGAGFTVFTVSSLLSEGIAPVRDYLLRELKNGRIAAFAGASGVGKSTLVNGIFPHLQLATAEISEKIERGRHTTRHVELFEIGEGSEAGYLADTPGFSLLDFERFDFFGLDDLLSTFRDFAPYIGGCRYSDCAHIGEGPAECAIARAAAEGKLAPSRLSSYRSIYRVLKSKNEYK